LTYLGSPPKIVQLKPVTQAFLLTKTFELFIR